MISFKEKIVSIVNDSLAYYAKRKKAVNLLLLFLFIISLAPVCWNLKDQIADYEWSSIQFIYYYLLLFILIFYLSYIFNAYSWQSIIYSLHYKISFTEAIITNVKSQIGKYIPGKVALIILKINLANRFGVPLKQGTVAASMEFIIQFLIVIQIGTLSLLVIIDEILLEHEFLKYVVLFAFILSFLILTPKNLLKLANWLLKFFKKEIIKGIRLKYFWYSFGLSYMGVLINGLSLCFIIAVIHPEILSKFSNIIFVVGAGNISFLIGLFAFFVPSGLGVSDVSLTYLLQFILPLEIALASVLLVRVLVFSFELVLILLVYLYDTKIIFGIVQ